MAAFRVAGAGVARSVRAQRNLRIHLVLAVVALATAAALRARAPFVLAVIAAIGLVVVAELLNSAVESFVDLASPELHPLARDAKDAAAAGVLAASIVALALGAVALAGALAAGPETAWSVVAVQSGVETVLVAAALTALATGIRPPHETER